MVMFVVPPGWGVRVASRAPSHRWQAEARSVLLGGPATISRRLITGRAAGQPASGLPRAALRRLGSVVEHHFARRLLGQLIGVPVGCRVIGIGLRWQGRRHTRRLPAPAGGQTGEVPPATAPPATVGAVAAVGTGPSSPPPR